MKTLRCLTFVATLFVGCTFVVAADPPAAPAAKQLPPAHLEALKELEGARDRLSKVSSISANLVETISIFPRSIRATGRYLQGGVNNKGSGWHLRSELKIKFGGTEGSQLEVCDGDILWTRTEIRPLVQRTAPKATSADSKGKGDGKADAKNEPQIMLARRNVTQILEKAAQRPDVPRDMLIKELGLGGMPALLASIQSAMIFDKVTNETRLERPVVVLEGTWNEAQLMRWNNNQPVDMAKIAFPAFIPERVQLVLDKESGFPHKIVYFKKMPERNVSAPLLTVEYNDVRVNQPIDKSEFVFVPPDQLQAMDMTNMYLERLAPNPGAPGAPGSSGVVTPQPPAGTP